MNCTVYKDASGRLVAGIDKCPASSYLDLRDFLVSKYTMVASSDLTLGLDSKYQSYSVEEASVEIGWDNWGGFMVIAIDKLSEKLVLEISECLVEYE